MVYFCVFVRWERLKNSLCVNNMTCTYVVDVKSVCLCLICKATEAKPTSGRDRRGEGPEETF